ncbi:MAG: HDOD domain-containing protein, partial [bacterium]|nr:HDOD domain-containing protein [bacterium]
MNREKTGQLTGLTAVGGIGGEAGPGSLSMAESLLRHKYVARQPIFDRDKKVVAYELLFRTGFDNFFNAHSFPDEASSQTLLDSFVLFGLKELSGGKRIFINFTRKILLNNAATAFPNELLVVELLENIQPDPRVISACRDLKEKGYLLALDDFEFHPRFEPLMESIDIVKVDFVETPAAERQAIVGKVGRRNIKFLAEKVETIDDFYQALEFGYSYFQGYFFSKPVVVSTKDMPSMKASLLRLLNKLYQTETDFSEIENIIKKDVSLAYKLLRFINSAAFGLSVEINSIMHALNLLGVHELRKWISLVALSQLSHDAPDELMTTSIVRARLCELIAKHIHMEPKSPEFFLVGLFSLIDVFFDRPMGDILSELPLSTDVKESLLNGSGIFGDVLKFVKAYEQGDWDHIFDISTRINLD